MAFLLSIDHQDNGTAHLSYDVGPTERLNFVTLTSTAHTVLDIPADILLGHSLATRRLVTSENWQTL